MPGITDCFVMVEQLEIWDIVPPSASPEKMSNIAVMLDKLILDLNRYTVLMYCWPLESIQYLYLCIHGTKCCHYWQQVKVQLFKKYLNMEK